MAQITSNIRRFLSEISYADRRSFELRTGTAPTTTRTVSPATARQIAELDATYALNHRQY